jgi:hypothetical protein
VSAILLDGLYRAMHWFDTPVPIDMLDMLARHVQANLEPSAVYLGNGLRPIDVLFSDLRALSSWRARARLLREHVLPPSGYMLRSYGVSSRALLPVLYADRVVRGARRWLGARPL